MFFGAPRLAAAPGLQRCATCCGAASRLLSRHERMEPRFLLRNDVHCSKRRPFATEQEKPPSTRGKERIVTVDPRLYTQSGPTVDPRKVLAFGLGGAAIAAASWQFGDAVWGKLMGNPAPTWVPLEDASTLGNPRVFLEVAIGGARAGRVEIELFANICPKTVENFRCLCTGEKGVGRSGKPLHFKGSVFHRIIPGFMCQGGDFTQGNGTGGESIYGSTFADEFDFGAVRHSEPMLLSMANAGRNTNGSQFFLTVAATPWLDGKHVVFGRVIAGADVVRQMEAVGTGGGATKRRVTVLDCGEVSPA